MGADETMESELGLGELAGLTVANEADSLAYDVSSDHHPPRPRGGFSVPAAQYLARGAGNHLWVILTEKARVGGGKPNQ